ncbi:MAG: hypothetical protein KIT11_00050 [Fimbriimonadaceae bacterium]|nr:hypothetical protein [Fimbriimonadaceae bacterium]QYK55234.1 MAG: hypothetical protein KF733_09485 [Fimbriimonadaceae bacterium]
MTPYIWTAGFSGSVRPFRGAPNVKTEKSFSEVFEDLDFAFFLTAYARKGRLVLMGDMSYADSSREGLIPPGVPASGGLRQTSLTLLGGARVASQEKVTFDVLGGFRTWWIKANVEVPAGGVQLSPQRSFTDFVLAARANFRLSDDWTILLYGDLGLFDLGSDETSQFVGTVNYRVSRDFFVSAGYRELAVDYRSGGTRVDARLSGLLFGATWRF